MSVVRIKGRVRECSSLVRCDDPRILEEYRYDEAFWGALDEGPVEQSIALVGRRRAHGKERWSGDRITAQADQDSGRTDDTEALSRHGRHIYAIGSQFGKKGGVLKPDRAFLARFTDELALVKSPVVQVRRAPFELHRAVNDAIERQSAPVARPGAAIRAAYVQATLARGTDRGKRWTPKLRSSDSPINVEGLDMLDDGTALIGLRLPVSDSGNPILVRVQGLPALFDTPGAELEVVQVHVIDAGGTPSAPRGVRALERLGDQLHVLAGPVPSDREGDVLATEYPGTGQVACEHRRVSVSALRSSTDAASERVRDFPAEWDVEGLTFLGDGRVLYAIDSAEGLELRIGDA